MHIALEVLLQCGACEPAILCGLGAALLGLAVAARGRAADRRDLGWLRRIASMVNRSADLHSLLAAALDEIVASFHVDAGVLRVAPTPEHVPVAATRGLSSEAAALIESGAGEAPPEAAGRTAAASVSEESAPARLDLAALFSREGLTSFALYPVHAGNRAIGTIALGSRQPRALSAAHEALLYAVSELVGVAVSNLDLRDQAHKLSEDLIALQEVNKIISQSLNLQEIIHRIVVEGRRLVKTSDCHLFLLDDRLESLVGAASTQTDGDLDVHALRIPLSERAIATAAVLDKRVYAVEDLLQDEPVGKGVLALLDARAAIFAPLVTKDQAIGVLICSDGTRGRRFSDEEILRADTLAHQAAIALENARLFQVVSRSQKEWETTFDAMQDCVSVHDTHGKVIRANVALARRLGKTPRNVVGKYCSEIYGPGDVQPGVCRHTRLLASQALTVETLEIPGMGGTFQVAVSPWVDKNNRLEGWIHVAKDISNEKLLQQQLIQSEKLSAIGELISGIAHELNNPLTGVMGYSQLLQLRKDLDDRARESLLKINNLALRCQKIVQNLLSFARKQKPERTWSDVNDILERTIELRNYELQVNNIEIEHRLAPDLPKTIADAHQLQQVFLNVITNAEQAMLEASGRGRLTIATRVDRHKERIIVEIVDDGPGIPEIHLNKIFDPFFTTKEVGKGTGLGLSLSYGIIKEHGGNIYARSRAGEGAAFVIELPIIARIPEAAPIAPELMPQALQFENLVRGKRILVVDDEKYILDFFVEVFQMYPMHVETASNGSAAREKIELEDYDVIITDFKMPQMSGRELFNWIKESRPDLAGRIIFVTGDTISADTRSFFEDHPNRYLAKPFKIEEVKEVIQQTLEGA